MRSHRLFREARQRALDAAIRAAQQKAARVGPRIVVAFQHLLAQVRGRTTALSPHDVATERAYPLIDALLYLAVHRFEWRRPLADWSPPEKRADVLPSLAAHLFALFPVPRFMASAWLRAAPAEQRWYLRLGAGESVRALDLPIPLDRRMAHEFRSVPDDLSIFAALRWAQVRGLGGSPELARAVATTRFGRESGDEFWRADVVRFLVEQEEFCKLDAALVNHLVEAFQRLASAVETRWPRSDDLHGDVTRCQIGAKTRAHVFWRWFGQPPPPPTPRAPLPRTYSWKPAPFGGLVWFRIDNGDARLRAWRIKELCSSDELREEGLAMRHCVATYAPKCASGTSSIWSMTVETNGERTRAVTIEVNQARREVCQVKGLANKVPEGLALLVLRRWVEEQGLQLSTTIAGML